MQYLIKSVLTVLLLSMSMNSLANDGESIESYLPKIEALLRANPEIVPSVHASLEQYVQQKNASTKLFDEHSDWLFANDDAHPWYGAENPELRVLVFTDYDCPYCKRLEPHLQQLIKDFPQVKVANIYIPLRQQRVEGGKLNPAQFALNVWQNQPNQFAEVHQLLYAKNGLHTNKSLQQIAVKTGTRSQLNSANATPAVMERNYRVFTDFGLNGTPAIMIGGQFIRGYVEYDVLKGAVAEQLD